MKREATVFQTKTAEKKARLEAEFVQNFKPDFTELQVENILKEISAPEALVQQVCTTFIILFWNNGGKEEKLELTVIFPVLVNE